MGVGTLNLNEFLYSPPVKSILTNVKKNVASVEINRRQLDSASQSSNILLFAFLLNGDAEVKTCIQTIQAQLESGGGVPALDYMVTKLEHVKKPRSEAKSEHEDVIATAVHKKTGDTKYISFGRFRGHVADQKPKNPSFFNFAIVDSSASTSASASSSISNAIDKVKILEGREQAPPSLVVFTPNDDSLSLLHLIFIAEQVHLSAPYYSLFKRQCYWFAMMMMAISMLQGGVAEIAKYRGKHKGKKRYSLEWDITVPRFPVSENKEINVSKVTNLPIEPPGIKDWKIILKAETGKYHGVRIIREFDANCILSSMEKARERYHPMKPGPSEEELAIVQRFSA